MTEEVWKDVSDFVGLYQVSSLGRVRSLDRIQECYGGRRWPRAGRILKLTAIKGKGYLVCSLVDRTRKRRPYVHELVLTAFVGDRPPDMEGCHNDGNPANNVVGNLRWGTHQSNCLDKKAHGTSLTGQKHHKAIYTDVQVAGAKKLLDVMSLSEIEKLTGVAVHTLRMIKRGAQWTHI